MPSLSLDWHRYDGGKPEIILGGSTAGNEIFENDGDLQLVKLEI